MIINLKIYGQDLQSIPSSAYGNVVKRVVIGVLTDIFVNLSYSFTSYSKGTCILLLNTIMIPFFAACILGDKVRRVDVVAIIFSFIGMFMIIRPFGDHGSSQNFKSDLIGILFAFMGAICSGLAIIYQKKLADSLHFT